MSSHSVTQMVHRLRDGSEGACRELWMRYSKRLQRTLERRLSSNAQRTEDAEEILLIAFESCFRAISAGKYPWIEDREDFQKLLSTIANNAMVDKQRHDAAKKRPGGDGPNAQIPFHGNDEAGRPGIEPRLLSREPPPEFGPMLADEIERLLGLLDGELLQQVAALRLEGFTHGEIAEKIDRSIPSVERYCRLIREVWAQETIDE